MTSKLALIGFAAILAMPVKADETLKWRHVQHASSFQTQDVGDIKGHALAVFRLPGIAFFSDGTVGSDVVIGASDTTDGVGTFQGYLFLTFPDGSELRLSFAGSAKPDGARNPRRGTYTVIDGTGRFQGAKGEGTFEGDGTRVGPELISYIDNVINIKK
jgi:hypothetical protein